jgi:hypothetical protein
MEDVITHRLIHGVLHHTACSGACGGGIAKDGWRTSAALDDATLKDIGVYHCAILWIAHTRCASHEMQDVSAIPDACGRLSKCHPFR